MDIFLFFKGYVLYLSGSGRALAGMSLMLQMYSSLMAMQMNAKTSMYPAGANEPPGSRLYTDLFTFYRPQIRPRFNDSETVDVTIHFYFKQILKVDETDQILSIHCWLEMFWKDDYLVWNETEYGGISSITVPADIIWMPDLLVYNNANMNVDENEFETNAIVSSNGDVMLFRSVITEITCRLDMTYFPFDEQACKLMLSSWAHDGSKIFLKPMNNGSDALLFFNENSEWIVRDYFIRQNIKIYDCCPEPYPDVTFYFIMTRNPGYYLNSLIIPSAFIALVTIIGFFTPHSSTGENTEKVSLGVTALLSMAIIMMMVANEMPATTNVLPVIGEYYIGLIFILFLAAFSTTLTLSTQMKGLSGGSPSYTTQWIFFNVFARCWLVSVMLPEMHSAKAVKSASDRKRTAASKYQAAGRIRSCCSPICQMSSPLRNLRTAGDSPQLRQHQHHQTRGMPPATGIGRRATTTSSKNDIIGSVTLNNNNNSTPKLGPGSGRRVALNSCSSPPSSQFAMHDSFDAGAYVDEELFESAAVLTNAAMTKAATGGGQPPVTANGQAIFIDHLPTSDLQFRSDRTTTTTEPATATTTTTTNNFDKRVQQARAERAELNSIKCTRLLLDIDSNLGSVKSMLEERESREMIARQWRQIARILERVFMIVFVVLIGLFAYYILTQQAPRLVMNTELMDTLSRV